MKEINANKDILLGRGPLCYRNPGNVIFRNMIQIHVVKYALDAPRSVKRAIVQSLIQEAHDQGRRFLARSTTTTTTTTTTTKTKMTESISMNTTSNTTTTTTTNDTMENDDNDDDDDDDNDSWCEASPKLIRSKVSHALRDARNSVNLQQQLQQQQQLEQQQHLQQQQQKLQSNHHHHHRHHHPYPPKAIQKYMRLSNDVSGNYHRNTYEYENYNPTGQLVRQYNPPVSMRRPILLLDSHGHCATRQTSTYNDNNYTLSPKESYDTIDTPNMAMQIVPNNNKHYDKNEKQQITSSVNPLIPPKRIHSDYWNCTSSYPNLQSSSSTEERDVQQQQQQQSSSSSSSSLSTTNIGWNTDSQDVIVYAIALLELLTSKQHTHHQQQQQQQIPLGTEIISTSQSNHHSNISKE